MVDAPRKSQTFKWVKDKEGCSPTKRRFCQPQPKFSFKLKKSSILNRFIRHVTRFNSTHLSILYRNWKTVSNSNSSEIKRIIEQILLSIVVALGPCLCFTVMNAKAFLSEIFHNFCSKIERHENQHDHTIVCRIEFCTSCLIKNSKLISLYVKQTN